MARDIIVLLPLKKTNIFPFFDVQFKNADYGFLVSPTGVKS